MDAEKQSLINAANRYLKEARSFEKDYIPNDLVEQIIQYYTKHQENITWRDENMVVWQHERGYTYHLSYVFSYRRVRYWELSMTKFQQFRDISLLRNLIHNEKDLEESRFDDFIFTALFERHGWASEHDQELTELLKEEKIAKVIKNIKDVTFLSSENECQRLFIKLFFKNSTNYQQLLHNGHFLVVIQNDSKLVMCLLETIFRDLEKRRLSSELIVDIIRIFQGAQLPPSTESCKSCFQTAFCGDISELLEAFADFDKTDTWPVEYTYMMEELLLTSLSTSKPDPIWQSIRLTVTCDPRTFAKSLRSFSGYKDSTVSIFEGLQDSIDLAHLASINRDFAQFLAENSDSYLVAFFERLTVPQLREFLVHIDDIVYRKLYDHSRVLFHSLLRQGAFMRHRCTISCKYHIFRIKPDDTTLDIVMKQYQRCEDNRSMVMQCMILGLIPEDARSSFICRVEAFHGSKIPEYPESLRYLLPQELADDLPAPKKSKITRKKKTAEVPSTPSYILPLESILLVPIDLINSDHQVAHYVKAVLWHYTKNRAITAADLTPQLNMLLWV